MSPLRLLLAGAVCLLLAFPAAAHDPRPVSIDLSRQADGAWSVAWQVPDGAGATSLDLTLGPDCELEAAAGTLTGEGTARCAAPPRWINLSYAPQPPSAALLLRMAWPEGRFTTLAFPEGATDIDLPAPETAGGVFTAYGWLGVEHILFGWDHLLFVLCLTALAGGWKRILVAVTGFTLGHSLTLSLSALDLVTVRIAPIEALIAGSILLLAYELARGGAETLTRRLPALISVAFGLVHGLGFAATLREIGLPESQLVPALLAFNLGVEAGQVAIVLIAGGIATLAAMAVPAGRPALVRSLAYVAGPIAAYWTVERVVGIFT